MPTLEENLIKLDSFKELKKDWNGYGAEPFNEEHIEKVKFLVSLLKIQPDIYPTARNSIQLEFGYNELEYEIFSDI